jgi:hypothetical protein
MANEREPRSLLEQAIIATGVLDGARAVTYVLFWGWATEKSGHPVSVEEVAEFALWGRAKAYKEQARFRSAFPGHETPAAIWAAAGHNVELRRTARNGGRGTAQLGASPPVLLA